MMPPNAVQVTKTLNESDAQDKSTQTIDLT